MHLLGAFLALILGPAAAALASVVVELTQGDSPDIVTISATNVGSSPVGILRRTSPFESRSAGKGLTVACDGEELQYLGAHGSYGRNSLDAGAFIHLAPNASTSLSVSLAPAFDVSRTSGNCTVHVEGGLTVYSHPTNPVAAFSGPAPPPPRHGDNLVTVPYATKSLSLQLRPREMGKLRSAHLRRVDRRLDIAPGSYHCNKVENMRIKVAAGFAKEQAKKARRELLNPRNMEMVELYWGNSQPELRQLLADRYHNISRFATAGVTSYQGSWEVVYTCWDTIDSCRSEFGGYEEDWLAYAYRSSTHWIIVACPNFFHLSIRSPFCHDKDATGNILHELTHCANVLSPRTHDYAYGWDNSVSLPTRQRIVNADSYELYAHDLGAKCFKGINHWNIPNPWFY